MNYKEIQTLALELGIIALEGKDLAAYAPLSDGCSGRLSWIYGLVGKKISCHKACVAHDFLYEWGGGRKERKKADKLLRISAARSGYFPPDWKGTARRLWRCFRAWAMYAAVRIFARRYWGS